MKTLLIITSLLLLFIGIVLAAIGEFSVKPKINFTSAEITKKSISFPVYILSIRQIDSLSAAANYSFTIQNSLKKG